MKQKAKRKIIKGWLLAFLSLTPILALIIGGYIVSREFVQKANESSGLSFQEMNDIFRNEKPITLILEIQLIDNGTQKFLKYNIGNIFINREYITSEICITGVFVQYPQVISSDDGFLFEVNKPDFVLNDSCVTPQSEPGGKVLSPLYSEEEMMYKLSDGIDESFYPFDEWSVGSVFLWLDIKDKSGKSLNVDTQIIPDLILPNWSGDIKLVQLPITVNGQQIQAFQVDMTLSRLLSSRFFSILLIAMSLLVITAILYIKETVATIELSLAILLGLWGIQGILIPSNMNGSTLIHIAIILLYVYFVAIISIRFLFLPTISRISKKDDD